jgi:23S rRNA (cytosine1962-C5)-methyltransferase
MEQNDLVVSSWNDYELLDSGENKKLERYGKYLVIRPETQAVWKQGEQSKWKKANAEFKWEEGKGGWRIKNMPESYRLSWEDVSFSMRLTSFKHTGIFPEQAANWQWLKEKVRKIENAKVLNLFGYTGIASIVCAKAGAAVTHVDASKQSNAWAKENAAISGVADSGIRFILDDVLKFAQREIRRGSLYEGIILDPPAFGRGPKGEVWKIEEDLMRLLESLKELLDPKPGSFFLLNGYAAGYSPLSFKQAIESVFPGITVEYGELRIQESNYSRCIPAGIYVRFSK